MNQNNTQTFIKHVLSHLPSDWLKLTTHRLDIYNEALAKTEFLEHLESLFNSNNLSANALSNLPTAYDYIRLGHPLSCVYEWVIAKTYNLSSDQVISFDSKTMPLFAILRTNLLRQKNTLILYKDKLPESFDLDLAKQIYGYRFDLKQRNEFDDISEYDGSVVYVSQQDDIFEFHLNESIDFYINLHDSLGSVLLINDDNSESYSSELQHVRRRETIAMTPENCMNALKLYVGEPISPTIDSKYHETIVSDTIKSITGTDALPIVGSSGLSIQYAIMMGLIHYARDHYKGKSIKFIVPPNCYGGTNDQARRVAACFNDVAIADLPVDGNHDMVDSLNVVLEKIANEDAVPFIIAEIPTNPRVEVPNLVQLKDTLEQSRKTKSGATAIAPVFILDQTFCPNVHFLGEGKTLSTIKSISYASGSKFPSGGRCTAGYCVVNRKADDLSTYIKTHLLLCNNEATSLQLEILAEQLPSMNQRIIDAYNNTRAFVNHIQEALPGAKINFVSEDLAEQGFMPSVFSLDLPTKGASSEEKETYKRALNHKLINLMISEIPDESKYCVSYGQLKGCYWTIPATSTQGTTKEDDKDYIARVALSPNMDLERHKAVFSDFVKAIS